VRHSNERFQTNLPSALLPASSSCIRIPRTSFSLYHKASRSRFVLELRQANVAASGAAMSRFAQRGRRNVC
jgi:hypothetical protein